MTFEPHPAALICPDKVPPRLSTEARKLELFAQAGMDVAIIETFDKAFAELSASQFCEEILRDTLGAKHVVVGHDFGYGRKREGDASSLRAAGAALGFSVQVIEPVSCEGVLASSSAIRRALIAGDLPTAHLLLGRHYDVDGPVVRGAGRGRDFGIPTANVDPGDVLLPKPGIYATTVQVLGKPEIHAAATSLGTNPTFVSGGALTLEAHLLDFEGDLYDQRLRVCFLERLRDEEQYADVDSLLAQIHRDIENTRAVVHSTVIKDAPRA